MSDTPLPLPRSSTQDTDLGFDSDAWLSRVARAAESLELGTLAGYRLIRVVARGSQGTVYEAVEPRTERRVAIKRLPSADPGPNEAARFAVETAALSALVHPNIVTLLAAPEADHSRLLVMEWLNGSPLDAWADAEWCRLTSRHAARAVVSCMAKVAAGVAAAHAHAIVHRDLKPSNVLVDPNGEPKVLDFGIAKPLNGDAQLTKTEGFTGTPAWAAPEQLGTQRTLPDVRVDVHGLGLLLYRALAGRCATDPTLPIGPLFAAIATQVPASPSKFRADVPRELDVVALKALEKDPARRYQTADALCQDLERFLKGEPVQAHPPKLGYLASKFVKRHRLIAASVAIALLAIVGGAVTSALFALDAREARTEAMKRADQAERAGVRAVRMNGFFRDLLANLREREAAGESSSARDIVSLAAASIQSEHYPPESEAELRETLGVAFYEIGDYKLAAEQLALALDAQERNGLADPTDRARVLLLLARNQMRSVDHPAAILSSREALAIYADNRAPDSVLAAAWEVHAEACLFAKSLAQARKAIETSVAIATKAQDKRQLALSVCTEALLLADEGHAKEAARRSRDAVQYLRESPDSTEVEAARVIYNAGFLCEGAALHTEALEYLEESLAIRLKRYGPGHPGLCGTRAAMAVSLRALGRFDEAVKLMEESLADFTPTHPSPNTTTANTRRHLGRSYEERNGPGDMADAVSQFQAAAQEFAESGTLTREQGELTLRRLVAATGAAQGKNAAVALLWSLPAQLSVAAKDPTLAGYVRGAVATELLTGPNSIRIAPDDRLIGALRADLELAARFNPPESRQVLQTTLALARSLTASPDPALKQEGREMARRAADLAEKSFGASSGAARTAQKIGKLD